MGIRRQDRIGEGSAANRNRPLNHLEHVERGPEAMSVRTGYPRLSFMLAALPSPREPPPGQARHLPRGATSERNATLFGMKVRLPDCDHMIRTRFARIPEMRRHYRYLQRKTLGDHTSHRTQRFLCLSSVSPKIDPSPLERIFSNHRAENCLKRRGD